MTDVDIGWLAGIIDGEGCITAQKTRTQFSVFLRINTTSPFIAAKLKVLYDDLGVKYTQKTRIQKMNGNPRPNRKPFVDTCVCNKNGIYTILVLCFPHLTEKQEQANMMLDFIAGKVEKTFLYESLKDMKKVAIIDVQASRLD